MAGAFVFVLMAASQVAHPSFHRTHKLEATACPSCHPVGPDSDAVPPSGPGTHARCDAENCHAAEFYEKEKLATTDVCLTCHLKKSRAPDPGFVPFPPARPSFYADMSHKRHTDSPDMSLECSACHVAQSDRVRHPACATCHDASAPVMSDCSGCHEPRVQGGETVRVGPTGLPSACRVTEAFAGKHPVHLSLELHQKKVSCDQCHPTVRVAENMAQLILTQGRDTMMKSCGACHGTARFPKAHALTDCAKCHIDECFTIGGSSVPAWHVRGTSR